MCRPLSVVILSSFACATHAINVTASSSGLFTCASSCGAANGTLLSTNISSFNAALALAISSSAASLSANTFMLLNGDASAAISFVSLSGAWTVDEPLLIPRQVVVALADGTSLAATRELETLPMNRSTVVYADGPHSALVAPGGVDGGARILCQGLSVRGVFAVQASGFNLEGITVDSCGGVVPSYCTGAVHFLGAPFASVGRIARSKIIGGCRGVWLQMYSRLYIYENVILNSSKFGVDFDSFSGTSVVWSNTIVGAIQNGIFIEQGAVYVTAMFNNITCGVGGNAIGVYPYQFGSATEEHTIAGNTIMSCYYALSIGSTKSSGNSTWTPASAVTFVANTLDASNTIGIHTNGPQARTVYYDNADAVGFDASAMSMAGSALAYDPLGRSKALNVSNTPSRTRSPSASKTPSMSQTPSTSPSPSVSASAAARSTSPTPTNTVSASPTQSSTYLPMPLVCAPFVAAAAAAASSGAAGNAPSSQSLIYAGAGAGAGGLFLGFLVGAVLFRRAPTTPSSVRTRAVSSTAAAERLEEKRDALVEVANPARAASAALRFRRVTEDGATWYEPEIEGDPVWVLPSGAIIIE